MSGWLKSVFLFLLPLFLAACDHQPWNDPYPKKQAKANIYYSSFSSSPKTLDPARSYSSDETIFIGQIYEPPLQYHFLKRPYTLVPLTATQLPKVSYLDSAGKKLPTTTSTDKIAYTAYEITLKPGVYYQPHPAFAKNPRGNYYYHALTAKDLKKIHSLKDFKHQGARELVADDYVYQIKRLAKPGVNSPIFGLMASKVEGLADLSTELKMHLPSNGEWLDLRQFSLVGAKTIDRYRYQILVKGKYPQFVYWFAMHFFCPIPWEADAFYSQPGMVKKNITFDWHPVGTGPYMLVENNPNRQMVLQKNPNFHEEYYPMAGERSDIVAGYLQAAGRRLPFIDTAIYTLEKESIPRWNKFLQGYYDQSTVSSDSFDQAIQVNSQGQPYLTPELQQKGVYLQTSVTQTISYMGFNMLDGIVGGNSERARKLRLAISIAIDFDEYINIFLNGRGISAQGPLPPGIFGYKNGKEGINPYIYRWANNKAERQPISVAKQLLRAAGYPNGIDPKTGEPLILNYDVATTSGPDEKALLGWMREQFAKIGIQLNIRNTDYNRFQEKMRLGEGQIFLWGWIADYPDPENFLFLLYGPNGKAKAGGENVSNYANKEFDHLFDQMKSMANDDQRQRIIDKMLAIVRHDSPLVWGLYQEDFILNHVWDYPTKISIMAHNTLKYRRINPILRQQLQDRWNQKVLWPLGVLAILIILISLPVFVRYGQKERRSIKK